MDIALGEPDKNLAKVRELAAEAARRGSDILVLPELWSTGYDLERAADYAAPIDGGVFAETATLAQEYGLHILGSCLSLMGEGRYGNTAVLFDLNGAAVGNYSKIHLFQPMGEANYLVPGDRPTLIETPWGKTGLAICYDLRFPELFRSYATSGARIIFMPSEWPYPRLAHWRTLIRARAIENQLYVVACNRIGRDKYNEFFGHSTIVDPCGEIVVEGGAEEMLLTAAVDMDKVEEVRASMPIFADRRSDVYGK
jgi:predicted amidohydrolase